MQVFSAGCIATSQNETFSDEAAVKAAENTFKSGGWNTQIFKQQPVTVRQVTTNKFFREGSDPALKEKLLRDFWDGPFTAVSYRRRPATLKTNGGQTCCALFFIVYSPSKVAVMNAQGSQCPLDKR